MNAPFSAMSGRVVAPRRHAGLSLIELMIAITLGVMLMLGMVEVFGTTRAVYQTASSLSRLQEGGRFAMEFIRGDLRMGGQWGCFNEYAAKRSIYNHLSSTVSTGTPPKPLESGAPWPYRTDLPIEGFEYEDTAPGDTVNLAATTAMADSVTKWTPALPAGDMAAIIGEAVAGSDVVVVRYAEADSVPIVGADMANLALAVADADKDFIELGGVYAVTDCDKMSLLQVTTAPSTIDGLPAGDGFVESVFYAQFGTGHLNQEMPESVAGEEDYPGAEYGSGAPEGEGAPIHRYRMVVYYVGLPSGETVPSLYRRMLILNDADETVLSPPQRLIDGVESLQISFGASIAIGADGRLSDLQGAGPTQYLTADALTGGEDDNTDAAYVNGFRRAKKVRAALLLRGTMPAAVEGGNTSYNVGDVMFRTAAGDTSLRAVYDTVVAVRNRY